MNTLPPEIRVGMKVYDSRHHHIGQVEDYKFPENATSPDITPAEIDGTDRANRNDTMLNVIAEAFGHDNIPEILRERLLTEGYVRLEADGLFAADRYILPEQISSATADELTLKVAKDELIKRN